MKDDKILVFAGTYEGRTLCQRLNTAAVKATACVATPYGMELLFGLENIKTICKRLSQDEMTALILKGEYKRVVDATHPYAKDVTANIIAACEQTQIPLIRLLREKDSFTGIEMVSDTQAAVDFLGETYGNVLVTTGSKELSLYCQLKDYKQRLYVRVLPTTEAVEQCKQLGFSTSHIIAMQGPFSCDMNAALISQLDCKVMVTKNTGDAGGIHEKIEAAQKTNIKTILIDRPTQETGHSLAQVTDMLLGNDTPQVDCAKLVPLKQYFPLFVSSKGKNVLLVGGGKIATRRVQTLMKFQFNITVVAIESTVEINSYHSENKILLVQREFSDSMIAGCDIVVAATSDHNLNAHIGKLAREKGLLVSVADDQAACNFFFPSVVSNETLTVGITSDGKDHHALKCAAQRIREVLE